jgi:peptidoglycan/xylan/chitin deacetylase (PgdA/CDA1 family)
MSERGDNRGLRIVTTSWDDGNPLDLRVAELLHSRSLKGTFYVPLKGYRGSETLCKADLRSLSTSGFEIGAHSVSHNSLRHLPIDDLDHEVTFCKDQLQDWLGREIRMFCYPNGHYDREVIEGVKRAGYAGARTCRMFSLDCDFPSFEMATTIQAFPHSPQRYLRNLGRALNFRGLWHYMAEYWHKNWVELGKTMFDVMLENGGVWHLYGHSWELDKFQLWCQLEQVLDYVAHRSGVVYTNNCELLRGFGIQSDKAGEHSKAIL